MNEEETVFGAPYTCPHCGKIARGQCTCVADKYSNIKVISPDFRLLLITFLKWYDNLSPASKVSVWSKDGSTSGLFVMDEEQLVDKFCNVKDNKELIIGLLSSIFDAGRAKTFTAVTEDGFNHFVYTYNKEDYLKQFGL